MKKFAKILSILLCVAMLAGMVAMIAAADESSAPAQSTTSKVLKPQYGSLPIPKYGYYAENGTYGTNDEGWYLVSGWFGQAGDLKNIPSGATVKVEFDFGNKPVTMGGLEIVSSGKNDTIRSFYIEVRTSDDGEWETVYTSPEAVFVNDLTVTAEFGKIVTAYELNIVSTSVAGSNVYLDEIAPLVEVETDLVPIIPNSAELVVYNGDAVGNTSGNEWVYDVFDAAFDDKMDPIIFGTASDHWAYFPGAYVGKGGTCTPILTMDLTNEGKPTAISEVTLYSYRGGERHTPGSFTIEARLEADGEWVVLKEYNDYDWRVERWAGEEGYNRRGAALTAEFDAVAAYELRIVVTANSGTNNAQVGWAISTIELAGPADGVTVEPETSEPDTSTPDTSEPETSEPATSEPETSEPETSEPETSEPETTDPEVPMVNAPVDSSKLTSVIGKYTDGTGADENTFVASGNGEALTDGDPNTTGKGGFTSADGLAAIILDIDGTIKLVGVEINPYDFVHDDGEVEGWGDMSAFTIQALVDGEWVDLVSKEGFLFGDARFAKFEFDAVETSKVRILVAGYYDGDLWVDEITLIETVPEVTDPDVPETTDPEVTDPEVTEPEATEPEATEPEATEPEATEPEATEPEATEPKDDPSKTGNVTLSVVVGMLAISAIGGGIVISKKKEF